MFIWTVCVLQNNYNWPLLISTQYGLAYWISLNRKWHREPYTKVCSNCAVYNFLNHKITRPGYILLVLLSPIWRAFEPGIGIDVLLKLSVLHEGDTQYHWKYASNDQEHTAIFITPKNTSIFPYGPLQTRKTPHCVMRIGFHDNRPVRNQLVQSKLQEWAMASLIAALEEGRLDSATNHPLLDLGGEVWRAGLGPTGPCGSERHWCIPRPMYHPWSTPAARWTHRGCWLN